MVNQLILDGLIWLSTWMGQSTSSSLSRPGHCLSCRGASLSRRAYSFWVRSCLPCRKRCERGGKYLEARAASVRLAELKTQEAQRMRQAIMERQVSQCSWFRVQFPSLQHKVSAVAPHLCSRFAYSCSMAIQHRYSEQLCSAVCCIVAYTCILVCTRRLFVHKAE